MKKSRRKFAAFRLIFWSLVALIFLLILVRGIQGNTGAGLSGGMSGIVDTAYLYENASLYQAGGGEAKVDQIREIEVNWTAGDVKIETGEGDTIRFQEEDTGLKEQEKMRYYVDGGKLIIQYREATNKLWENKKDLKKTLTLIIPERAKDQLRELNIDTVSADISIEGIMPRESLGIDTISGTSVLSEVTTGKLQISTVSGAVKGTGVTVEDQFEMDSISAGADLQGRIERVVFDAVSGELRISSSACPQRVKTDTVSGTVTLELPEKEGFRYTLDSASGKVRCSFDTVGKKTGKSGSYGDGSRVFTFDSVSGDVILQPR